VTASATTVRNAVSGLNAGKNVGVWTVRSPQEVQQLFDEMTQGGASATWKGYPGQVVELPDGTQIGLRGMSRSGGPTIDIRIPGEDPWKIHIGP
jgi:hypothetical protein